MGSQPIKFHETCGANIRLSDDRTEAVKVSSYFEGLCFTSRRLVPGEKLVLNLYGKGRVRGIRFGVTDEDPRWLAQDMPDFIRSGLHPSHRIRGGEHCGVRDLPDLNLDKDIIVYFDAENGKLMIQNSDSEPRERVTGILAKRPLYFIFDLALHNLRIRIHERTLCAPQTVPALTMTMPEPDVRLKSRTFKNLELRSANFTCAGQSSVKVRPHFAMNRDTEPSVGNFAFVETLLKPGATLVVEIIELKKFAPVEIVVTAESAEEVFSCGCLLHLCDTSYSLMMESEVPSTGDELAVRISKKGAVSICHNNKRWYKRLHVDKNLEYHVAFGMGNVSILSMVGITPIEGKVEGKSLTVPRNPQNIRGVALPECVICLENVRAVAVIPCYHVVMCAGCAHSLRQSRGPKCPLCRVDITEVRKIYMA